VRRFAAIAVVAATVACFPAPEEVEQLVPDAPREAARALLVDLEAGDMEAILASLHPDTDPEPAREGLRAITEVISASSSFTATFGTWQWRQVDAVGVHELAYELTLDEGFVLLVAAFREHEGVQRLYGLRFDRLPESLVEVHRFGLEGRSAVHYVVLAAAVAVPLLCVTTLVLCWRRRPRFRWLWMPFIAVTFPVLILNWTTGELSLQLVGFNLLGASFFRTSVLDPVFVQVGIPIGALAFLILRPERREDDAPPRMEGVGVPRPPA